MFNKMSPKVKQIVVLGLLIAGVLLVVGLGVKSTERGGKGKKEPDVTKSVLLDKSESRNASLDALAVDMRKIERNNKALQQQIKDLENLISRQGSVSGEGIDPKKLNRTLQSLTNQVTDLQEQIKALQRAQLLSPTAPVQQDDNILDPEELEGVSDRESKDEKIAKKDDSDKDKDKDDNRFAPTVARETTQPKADSKPNLPPDSIFSGEPVRPHNREVSISQPDDDIFAAQEPPKTQSTGSTKISIMSETHAKVTEAEEKQKKDQYLFLPAGSIITGVILNGMDAPTGQASREHQFPSLVRIQKEAILPNRFRSDIRECFVIVSGYGDLSSERAYLRGETLSCVRKDKRIIEGSLDSYAVGEDGKNGLRGRLVSKQGQIIIKSLMAGFLSGLADAFDVNATPTINTSSNGRVSYERVWSTSALQGAATKGISSSLDRIAEFYVKMAEGLYPVIEIDAGRRIDLILTKGAKITLQDVGDGSLTALREKSMDLYNKLKN